MPMFHPRLKPTALAFTLAAMTLQAQSDTSDKTYFKAPTAALTLASGNPNLVNAFNSAKNWALSLVVTPGYVGHDADPMRRVSTFYDTDAAGDPVQVVDPRNNLYGDLASHTMPAYWGTYAPARYAGDGLGRECFCARDIAHSVVGAHLLGLDNENYAMLHLFAHGANTNPVNAYWPKWSYDFFGTPFYMDSDWRELSMPFDIGRRLWVAYQWTGDKRYLDDSDFITYQTNLHTNFMANADQNGSGVAEEHIQLASYWEQSSETLIEASDSFGCQVESMRHLSQVLAANGDSANASLFATKAQSLRQQFHDKWYSWSDRRYVRGLDTFGNMKTDWGHEASIFVPLTLLGDQGARDQAHVEWIHASTFEDPINIESTTYYPEVFYNFGRGDLAWYWMKHDIASGSPYPEVSFLLVGNIVTGMMGVQYLAQSQQVTTEPQLVTGEVPWVEADHIPAGTNDINVRHDGNTQTTLTNNNATGTVAWQAQFDGFYPTLLVDNVPTPTQMVDLNGRNLSTVNLTVAAGSSSVVAVPAQAAPGFDYLSDLQGSGSGSGPILDGSPNQLNGGNDIIMLGWKAYQKGISTASGNTITYALNQNYTRFTAMVGVDNAVGFNGNGIVSVQLDGTEIFNTGVMTSATDVQALDLDVSNGTTLVLQVTDNGTGSQNWVDFGNAMLHQGTSQASRTAASVAIAMPVPATPAPGATVLPSPSLPAGFTATLRKSSNPALVALNGTIQPPDYDEPVSLVWDITRTADQSVAQTTPRIIYIPGGIPTTAAQLANRITAIPQPARGDTQLVLPGPFPGFTVTLARTGDPTHLTTAGHINEDADPHALNAILQVKRISDGTTALTKALPVNIPSLDCIYLTDLDWTSCTQGQQTLVLNPGSFNAKMGWRTMVRDSTITGKTLSMGGHTYARGLGCFSPSTVTYNLGGKFQTFTATIGLDDEAAYGGGVFSVSGDSIQKYSSASMKVGDPSMPITVDVTGVQTLTLTLANGGSPGEGDWADARLWDHVAVVNFPTFTIQPLSQGVIAGSQVILTAAATGGNLTYQWMRNGVAIPGATTPNYTFVPTAGDVGALFCLQATNGAGVAYSNAATLSLVNLPNQQPIAMVNGAYVGSINVPIAFSSAGSLDPDGTVASYLWNFGDGTTSNLANPTHTYTSPSPQGTPYIVSLTVMDNLGLASAPSTTTVTVLANPLLTTNPTYGNSIGTAMGPLTNGVTLTATDPSGYHQDYYYFIVDHPGTITCTLSTSVAQDQNDYLVLMLLDPTQTTLNGWTLTNQPTVYTQAVTAAGTYYIHTYGPSGVPFNYSITVSGDCLNASIDAIPAITTPPANASAASGGVVTLNVAASGGNLFYQWQRTPAAGGSAVNIPNAISSAYSFVAGPSDQGAQYDVVITNSMGTVTSPPATLTLTSAELPPTPVIQGPVVGMTGQSIAFSSAQSSDPQNAACTYLWNFGDGASSTLANPTHAYAVAGTYQVTLALTDSLGLTTVAMAQATIVVAPPTTVSMNGPLSTVFGHAVPFYITGVAQLGTLASYAWTFGDGTTSTLASPSHLYPAVGVYPVSLTVTDVNHKSASTTSTVTVGTNPVTITPLTAPAAMPVNAQQNFSATVTGSSTNGILWSATGGTVTETGVFTAGTVPGPGSVTATSLADSTVTSTDTFTIKTLDLNGDGAVDIIDLAYLCRAWTGNATAQPNFNAAADLNGDGLVNALDLALFLGNF